MGSRLLQLRPGAKQPYGGAQGNAHLGAVVDRDFVPTGKNIGIVLDGMWLLVDIDKPADPVALRWIQELEKLATWKQHTPRQHATPEQRASNPHAIHYLFAAPAGLLEHGAKNSKVIGADGKTPVADIKVRGYLVAPGSEIQCDDGILREYVLVQGVAPVAAPTWLVDFAKQDQRQKTQGDGTGVDAIPSGFHDDFLVSVAGFLRRNWGMSEGGIAKHLPQLLPALDGYDPMRPYTTHDMERIARSASRLDLPQPTAGPLVPENWLTGDNIDLVGPPVEWWLRHFVPKGELVMLFGKGGIGKSSWASWFASEVTRLGGSFVFFGVEEPFKRFLWRAVLSGADRKHLFSPADAGRIRLPRDMDMLKRAISISGAQVVYFDSIMSHFEHLQGLNIAERTRLCLAPLAEIAQETGATVICVFHENRAGEFMGSAEMENVGRYVLGAKREAKGPLTIEVTKTNFVQPDYKLSYTAKTVKAIDPLTGKVQYERLEDGTLAPYELTIPEYAGRLEIVPPAPETVPSDEQETLDDVTARKRSYKKRV